jgi:hypothetical protein
MFFVFLEPFRQILTLKLAKVLLQAKNYYVKIRYEYHKTPNLMLSSNPLKKVQKISLKKSLDKILCTQ